MSSKRIRAIGFAVVVALPVFAAAQSSQPTGAAPTPESPTTSTTSASKAETTVQQHMSARIVAIRGHVQYRETASAPLKPCTVGLVVEEGAEFLTGPRSNVQLMIPPHQTITLDRLGSMTLLEAAQQNGRFTTDVGLKHGRVRYKIEAPGIEHESTVSSPNGTLAVRDTSFAVDDEAPFPPEAYRLSGTVDFSTAKRTISIGGSVAGNVKAVGDQDPANTSLSEAVQDPSLSLSRTPEEVPLVQTLLSRGAVFAEYPGKKIPIVSGGSPPSDAELQKTLPGALDFVLRWDGNANLDLALISLAKGETLYPATGLNTSPSGGMIPFNDIGGPNGGIELAYWKKNYPIGLYELIINDVSGVPVNYTANVFEKGALDGIFTSTTAGTGGVTSLTGTIQAGQVFAGLVEVGGGSPVPPSPPTPPSSVTKIPFSSSGNNLSRSRAVSAASFHLRR